MGLSRMGPYNAKSQENRECLVTSLAFCDANGSWIMCLPTMGTGDWHGVHS